MFKGEDILTISQTNVSTPILTNLAYELEDEDIVEVASPEVYAFSYTISRKDGHLEPVIVRGVDPGKFLEIEDASMQEGGYHDNFMLVGSGLSKRLGIKVGQSLTLTGSTTPALLEMTITGIISSKTSSNDQILIPISCARKLMDLGNDDVLIIRVKTDNKQNLIDYLTDHDYTLVVTGKDGIPIPVNYDETYEEQIALELAIKYSDPEGFSATNQSFVSTFVQRGSGTIGVVVLGFIALNAILSFIGITAILARAVIERRKDIGILAAIGADKKAIYLLLLKDLLIISIISSGIGVVIGFISAEIVKNLGLIVAFGMTIQPTIELSLFIITFFVAIIIGCTSGLMVSSIILTEKPSKLIQEIEDKEEVAETETLAEAIGV
jgi:ABC-type lipoprotein release transport system permease subunit